MKNSSWEVRDSTGKGCGKRNERARLTTKKIIRTLQVNFPSLLEFKFSFMRLLRILRQSPFEQDFNALKLFPDLDGALYLDVGANRGQSTDAILMAKKNAQIHMFEPNQYLYQKLQAMFCGDTRITVDNFGIGEREASEPLYVPFFKQWMFDGLASFDRSEAEGWLRNNLVAFDRSKLTFQENVCSIRSLDDLELQPFFIKMDIQGLEYQALLGGKDTLRRHTPILLIEAPTGNVIRFLASFGYDIFAYRNNRFVAGETGDLNTFFITPAKARMIGHRHFEFSARDF